MLYVGAYGMLSASTHADPRPAIQIASGARTTSDALEHIVAIGRLAAYCILYAVGEVLGLGERKWCPIAITNSLGVNRVRVTRAVNTAESRILCLRCSSGHPRLRARRQHRGGRDLSRRGGLMPLIAYPRLIRLLVSGLLR